MATLLQNDIGLYEALDNVLGKNHAVTLEDRVDSGGKVPVTRFLGRVIQICPLQRSTFPCALHDLVALLQYLH